MASDVDVDVVVDGVDSSARSIIVINVGGSHKSWLTLPGKCEGGGPSATAKEGVAFVVAIKP